MSPPPPKPVRARMMSSISILSATEQPKQPVMNVTVDMKKQIQRPNMSENRPYSGWKAVLVTRYAVVNHAALLAALNSEPMAAPNTLLGSSVALKVTVLDSLSCKIPLSDPQTATKYSRPFPRLGVLADSCSVAPVQGSRPNEDLTLDSAAERTDARRRWRLGFSPGANDGR
ncbi:hypothetical protein VTH82DRAFT_1692 [Thermothelomyces myriococcoides]